MKLKHVIPGTIFITAFLLKSFFAAIILSGVAYYFLDKREKSEKK